MQRGSEYVSEVSYNTGRDTRLQNTCVQVSCARLENLTTECFIVSEK